MKHLLIKVRLPQSEPEKQHKPDPFGVLPGGHVPLKPGVVQEPPADARLQVLVTACASRQRFPPITVAPTLPPTTATLNCIFTSHAKRCRQEEKATPAAEVHVKLVPAGP